MSYPITVKFGQLSSAHSRPHTGYDLAMPDGTPLRSIQDGVIEKVTHYKGNIGNGVLVRWNDGKTAIYGHMSKISVKEGDKVSAGELIGYSGHSGNVYSSSGGNGAHLHFGLKDASGKFINPEPYIDLIQNMNNPNFIKQHVADIVQKTNFSDFMQQHADIFNKSMEILKVQLVHIHDFTLNVIVNVSDHSFFMQIFQ